MTLSIIIHQTHEIIRIHTKYFNLFKQHFGIVCFECNQPYTYHNKYLDIDTKSTYLGCYNCGIDIREINYFKLQNRIFVIFMSYTKKRHARLKLLGYEIKENF